MEFNQIIDFTRGENARRILLEKRENNYFPVNWQRAFVSLVFFVFM